MNQKNDHYLTKEILRKFDHKYSSFPLMAIINEHKYVEDYTRDCDRFFRLITFIVYFIATPGLQMALFGTHHPYHLFNCKRFFEFIQHLDQ